MRGTEFKNLPLHFDDVLKATFNFMGWVANLALGIAVTALFVAAAVLTAGTSVILTGAVIGAAVGAGVATTAIAVSDYQSGKRAVWKMCFWRRGWRFIWRHGRGGVYGSPCAIKAISSALADFAATTFTITRHCLECLAVEQS